MADNSEKYAAERNLSYDHELPLTEITIRTRVPSKWRMVDLETGEIWRWAPNRNPHFIRVIDISIVEKE